MSGLLNDAIDQLLADLKDGVCDQLETEMQLLGIYRVTLLKDGADSEAAQYVEGCMTRLCARAAA